MGGARLLDFVRALIKRELAYINVENDEFASSSLVLGAFDEEEAKRAAKAKKKGGLFSRAPAPAPEGNTAERISIGHVPRRLRLAEQESDETRERAQIAMIRNLTLGYFDIVKKTLADAVPKAVVRHATPPLSVWLQPRAVRRLRLVCRVLAGVHACGAVRREPAEGADDAALLRPHLQAAHERLR